NKDAGTWLPGCRPFLTMSTTSIAMQPASAMANACGGVGPATPSLSSTMLREPLLAANRRSPCHTSVAVVGGFDIDDRLPQASFEEPRSRRRLSQARLASVA